MLPRERILETLLELSHRSSGRSRPVLLEKVLRNALLLGECEGAVLLASQKGQFERLVLVFGQSPDLRVELGLKPGPESVDELSELIVGHPRHYPKPDRASQAAKTPQIQPRQQLDGR